MLIIALFDHIQKSFEKFVTRRQLSELDVSRYEDIHMTLDDIHQEIAKGNIGRLTIDILKIERG